MSLKHNEHSPHSPHSSNSLHAPHSPHTEKHELRPKFSYVFDDLPDDQKVHNSRARRRQTNVNVLSTDGQTTMPGDHSITSIMTTGSWASTEFSMLHDSNTDVSQSTVEPVLPRHSLFVPDNALFIIKNCLDAQRTAMLALLVRQADDEQEAQQKLGRLAEMQAQNKRREQWARMDAAWAEEMTGVLEEIGLAVRDRRTTLHAEGYQAFIFRNKDIYEGQWKNSRMHGKGCLRRAALGDVYEGQWYLGQRAGPGAQHSALYHTFYSGTWLDNRRHGKGELVEPEGVFVGDFVENRIHGYGDYVFRDGHVYKGEWVAGLPQGAGTYLYPSGARYEGQWEGGLEHGVGCRTYTNGDMYTGDWVRGRPHGYGTYTCTHFEVEGEWHYGALEGEASCVFSDGSRYKGRWHKDRFHGEGEFSTADGTLYRGDFVAGRRQGRGTFASGQIYYEGGWDRDGKEGSGSMTLPTGSTYEGSWRADQLHGRGEFVLGKERLEFICDNGIFKLVNDLNRSEKIDGSLPETRNGSQENKPYRAINLTTAASSPKRMRSKLNSFRSIGELGSSATSHTSTLASPTKRREFSQTIPNLDVGYEHQML